MIVGLIALLAGRLAEAAAHFETSTALWGDLELIGTMRWALAGSVITAAMRGDRVGAQRELERLEALPAGQFLMMEPVVERARAWATWINGVPVDAARLVDSGSFALERGAPALTGAVMHDLARLGAIGPAGELRARLPTTDGWPLQEARVAYVDALIA